MSARDEQKNTGWWSRMGYMINSTETVDAGTESAHHASSCQSTILIAQWPTLDITATAFSFYRLTKYQLSPKYLI